MSGLRWKFGRVNLVFTLLLVGMILALGRALFFWPAVPYVLALSPDGTRMAAWFDRGPILVWDFSGPRPRRHVLSLEYEMRGYTPRDFPQFWHASIRRMLFVNTRQLAIFHGGAWRSLPSEGPRGGTEVTIWDIEQDRQVASFFAPGAQGWSVFSEEGRVVASTVKNGILVWDVNTGKCISPGIPRPYSRELIAPRFSPDGKTIVAGACASVVDAAYYRDVFDAFSGRQIEHKEVPELEPSYAHPVVFSKSAGLLACRDQIRRVSTLELQATLEKKRTHHPWWWLSFGANDRQIAAVDPEGVGVWDTSTGKLLAEYKSPDVKARAIASDLLEIARGVYLRSWVSDLAVASDAPVVAFAEDSRNGSRIILWNTDQQERRVVWEFSYLRVVWCFSAGFIGLGIVWGLVGARWPKSKTLPADREVDEGTSVCASPRVPPLVWVLVISGGVVAVLNALVLHYYFIRPYPGWSFSTTYFSILFYRFWVSPLDWLRFFFPLVVMAFGPAYLCLGASLLGICLGVLAITCGVSRNERVLPLALKLQVASLFLGDPVNLLLGVASRLILRRARSQH